MTNMPLDALAKLASELARGQVVVEKLSELQLETQALRLLLMLPDPLHEALMRLAFGPNVCGQWACES